MKKLVYISLTILLFLPSCYKDIGNYNYVDAEVISVEGIEESYDVVSAQDSLVFNPIVSSTDPDAEFEYFWALYPANVQGYVPDLDTLTHTKALRYLVALKAKTWELVFCAKNTHSGLSKIIEVDLNVSTNFTRGWYVLKDNGTYSDIDQFLTPDTIVPTEKVENIFSTINGRKLAGKAKQLAFSSTYKTYIADSTSLSNTRTLFALSENDLSAIYIDDFSEVHSFDDIFYDTPDVAAPEVIKFAWGASAVYLINNGQLYYIYTAGTNEGIFGTAILKNDNNDAYSLSQYSVNDYYQNIFYDELEGSFVSHGSSTTLLEAKDHASTTMPAQNTNKDLLYLGTRSFGTGTPSIALFRDRTDTDLVILSQIKNDYDKLKIINDTITSEEKLYEASLVTVNQDEKMIYFQVNNELWSFNLANSNEILQFSAPEGEEITFFRHLQYSSSSDEAYAFDYIMVATTDGTNYKVYFYRKSSGNLYDTPDFIVEGEGRVGDVIYVAPNVSTYSYLYGY